GPHRAGDRQRADRPRGGRARPARPRGGDPDVGLPHSLNAATSASIAVYEYCRWAAAAGSPASGSPAPQATA
ncbi:MAG: hypothetical protein ACKOWG_05665, partial [Planctomycetia bacterium]